MTDFKIEHKNPDGLFSSKAFSQAITVSGKAKTIYIGGQNAINSNSAKTLLCLALIFLYPQACGARSSDDKWWSEGQIGRFDHKMLLF